MDVTYTLHRPNGRISLNPSEKLPEMFEKKSTTIFLIHGFVGNTVQRFNDFVKDEIFKNNDVNVIVVDWIQEAGPSYGQARKNVRLVAEDLVTLINWLNEDDNINLSDFHLVGFDLGAHVAGIAGRHFSGTDRIARITGLNPSGRQWGPGSGHLTRGDATYVEVIHTDTLGVLANGIGDPIGDVDFYPNGGNNQPGCLTHSCCHDRAFELFAASTINSGLRGQRCDSKTQMNLNLCRGSPAVQLGRIDPSKGSYNPGIYRLSTSRRYPFY